jgi:hypothetical protein
MAASVISARDGAPAFQVATLKNKSVQRRADRFGRRHLQTERALKAHIDQVAQEFDFPIAGRQ